ncbi:MAG: hypothetical protein JXB17_12690 [Bacteroidales bacterium]|nr:hypothetical protein [Bacteroidales bacterium]
MNKKCLKFLGLIALLAMGLTIVFISCSKEDITGKQIEQLDTNTSIDLFDHVTLKNGALCFDSAKYVSLIADTLLKMPYNLRKEWENNLGFVSMYMVMDKVHDELGNCKTKEEYDNILSSYSDVIKVSGEDIDQIIPLNFHTAVINREGIYYIGKSIVKITPTSKIIVWSGDKSKINLAENNLKSTEAGNTGVYEISDDVKVIDYFPAIHLKTTPTPLSNGYSLYAYELNSSGNRKIKFWIYCFRDDWGNHDCDWYWKWMIEVKIENWKKDLWWHKYMTTCSWEQVTIGTSKPIQQTVQYKECGGGTVPYDPYILVQYTIYNYAWSSGSSEEDDHSESWRIGDEIQNNVLPLPQFYIGKGRATNRGLGGKYAVICYPNSNCPSPD